METLRREVEVDAEDEREARKKVEAMYDNEEVVLGADDWFDTTITVTENAEGPDETE